MSYQCPFVQVSIGDMAQRSWGGHYDHCNLLTWRTCHATVYNHPHYLKCEHYQLESGEPGRYDHDYINYCNRRK